ncbi:hypothetical protein FF1_017348 [Malus domestica]|uniref:uncharacterized protein LOC126604538 isoform X1 n=1 Tax=Malus sylvestris TaxID=3752 RepID=UPI0010AA070B|nr:uncharacterized protein LOC103456290 [Malus domestica]XP_028949888.1 uncharacterized protein LOC103456290 [Malus domestica]XP_028949889.1 uncharacterized protein LOC103456290 [Malus domestica]XP_050127781.1 uncharacterized protein LOC126604538 isoform X1 [Malus sylvestris]XP_050127782.1 uncharacterized protein LOC126604538 isoform X1 [Malus sylvestris]XP_050127783.1 uncharacterized protein LOC126604538 isoform X1 [Malus sylvestris]
MAITSCGSNGNHIKIDGAGSSDELDYLPLIQRRNLLLVGRQNLKSLIGVTVKEEDELSKSQDVSSFPSVREVGVELLEEVQNQYSIISSGATSELLGCKTVADPSLDQHLQHDSCSQNVEMPGDSDYTGTKVNTFVSSEQIVCTDSNVNVAQLEKTDVNVSSLPESPSLLEVHAKGKVAYSGSFFCSSGGGMNGFAGSSVLAVQMKSEISDHSTYDHLDHISLKERQKMLQSRKLFGFEKALIEDIPGPLSKDLMQQLACKGQADTSSAGGEALVATSSLHDNSGRNSSVVCRTSMISSPHNVIVEAFSTTYQYSVNSNKSNYGGKGSESDKKCSSERMPPNATELSSCGGQDYLPTCTSRRHCSTPSTSVKVKDEPWDDGVFQNQDRNAGGKFSFDILPVKNEPRVFNEINEDEVDHMRLRDRLNLLASGYGSELNISRSHGCFVKVVPSAKYSPIASESAKPINVIRPRKRKKTATDSVETALEEDAPGLLQVLVEKGVLVNEIRLYGEIESDEALEESLCEDNFAELEAVISKLFSQRQPFFKFAPIRCTKGSRVTYCLACLISLVEQSRYLQFRNWPVEWGWCRDLQSFIFVFAKHNRIVLERPEYGYATYFFELLDSLPIEWQIKRLVTAMKLTSCSRISLIEDKALSVGDDLTEGDAQVLMEYGWEPNTGLGTMLKYRGRVVHDRRNETDSSEWRSKIGKLLIDGYNGGTLITNNIPKKVLEYIDAQGPEIKLEL